MHMSAHHFSPKQNKTYLSAKKKKTEKKRDIAEPHYSYKDQYLKKQP